jgi:hypothetical protein
MHHLSILRDSEFASDFCIDIIVALIGIIILNISFLNTFIIIVVVSIFIIITTTLMIFFPNINYYC